MTHKVDHLAGADAVIEAHPAQVLRVLPAGQHVLVAHVVGAFVHHPGSALNADGVAAGQVGVKVRAVTVTLIPATLEVLVLVKDDLEWIWIGCQKCNGSQYIQLNPDFAFLCVQKEQKYLVHYSR